MNSPDTFSRAFQGFQDFAGGLSPTVFWSIARAATILILATICLGVSFRNLREDVSRSSLIPLQAVILGLSFLLVVQIPIPTVSMSARPKAFILAPSLAAIAVLPIRMATLLHPEQRFRRIIALSIYAIMGVFILAALFFK